ncbi:MAG: hypothetical protein LBT85_00880 [Bifidobacteriaceae bacterium]|jgi:hypothetical protein|nr:hypothetical protein [Bifidobacteriaceae bacterium]
MKKVTIFFVALAMTLAGFVFLSFYKLQNAQAAGMDYWNAGQIISDSNFWTSGKMSKDDIQTFLKSKAPDCSSSGDNKCLKDYKENTNTREADTYCSGRYAGASGESSATIISKVSAACKISEKVLLVMLQKEQGLVTALWSYYVDPNGQHKNDDSHFKSAMGMGCPDTAACDSKYYGFFNQVYSAARQLNVYKITESYNYKPGRENFVRYSPTLVCGGTDLYIANWATAALYTYTPYQPNAAALANPYGTGDSCSAYGNRNFFRTYSDWFGRPNSYYAYGAIGVKYGELGGASGRMGSITSYEMPDNKGSAQTFQGGNIYWLKSNGGTFSVWGAIKNRYSNAMWGRSSYLGYPTSNELPRSKGVAQTFQGGTIYWVSKTNKTYIVKGAIKNKYSSVNGTNGFLSFPKSDELLDSRGVGQIYDNGKIFWTSSKGAYIVYGAIGDLYNSLGSRAGRLGYPVSDEKKTSDGKTYQDFENGQIYWTKSKGAWVLFK